MVNFGIQAAEIVSLVWGTPANFNGFRVLAALLHVGHWPTFLVLLFRYNLSGRRLEVYHTSTHGVALVRI